MTGKNMARLAQFDDPRNLRELISLPDKLMKRAKDNPQSSRAGLDAMYAVAIILPLSCPMRVRNLASLELGRHITERREGLQRRFSVRIKLRHVKNKTAIDVDLGTHPFRILRDYLDHFRRAVSDNPGTALFSRRSGGRRTSGQLGQHLSKVIHRETGLEMNPHLFRHLSGMTNWTPDVCRSTITLFLTAWIVNAPLSLNRARRAVRIWALPSLPRRRIAWSASSQSVRFRIPPLAPRYSAVPNLREDCPS